MFKLIQTIFLLWLCLLLAACSAGQVVVTAVQLSIAASSDQGSEAAQPGDLQLGGPILTAEETNAPESDAAQRAEASPVRRAQAKPIGVDVSTVKAPDIDLPDIKVPEIKPPTIAVAGIGQNAEEWTVYADEENGFVIDIPQSWEVLELTEAALNSGLDIVAESNEQLSGFMGSEQMRQMVESGMKLYAIDLSEAARGFTLPPNVNVLVIDTGVTGSVEFVERMNLAQIEQIADESYALTHSRVEVGSRDGIRFQYMTPYALGFGEPQDTVLQQLLVIDGSTQFIVTIGVPLEIVEEYTAVVERMIGSFQLLN